MKLNDHVDKLRNLINKSFDKYFAKLGIGSKKYLEIEKLSVELHKKRSRLQDILDNHINETGSYEKAREKILDELTFTLFNRIAAIKVMEASNLFPPIITKQTEHGGRSFGHKAWLEERPDMRKEDLEGIREYIKHAFNELGKTISLYSKEYPYALLPDTISLNEIIDTFNEIEKDSQLEDKIWQSDDILGWLYESYNNTKKQEFKDSGDKVEYNKVSIQSQVYTPRWVVEFLVNNSLGKLYLEMYPDSNIKNRYKIANAPTSRVRESKPLKEVKLIDPASGSGNFLLYAFDLFYELYKDQIENYGADYEEKDIPKLIIENNIYGIDLDDRATQLAQLGLYIKARKKKYNNGSLNFNVVSSDFFLPDYEVVSHIFEANASLDAMQKKLIQNIWGDLKYAYKFGSLIQISEKLKLELQSIQDNSNAAQANLFTAQAVSQYKKFEETFFEKLTTAVEQYAEQQGNTFLCDKTRDAIIYLKILTNQFDIATANPPYTYSSDFGEELKIFIENNYKKPFRFDTNLYAVFIKRCFELTNKAGKIALIHPRTFMFIKTFEDVRQFILDNTHINVFADYSLSNLFGTVMVDPAFYVLEKEVSKDKNAWFISLDQYTRTPNEKFKKDFCLRALDNYINGVNDQHNYSIPQNTLKVIKSYPFIYWISDEFRSKFKSKSIDEVLKVRQGIATGDNNRCLRFWWEVDKNTILKQLRDGKKWVVYSKGGPYQKWYGNLWLVINFDKEGYNYLLNNGNHLPSKDYYFLEGITYSASGSKGASFRYLPENKVFDVGGSCVFPFEFKDNYYSIAFMNSKLCFYIVGCLNPTVNTQVGDLKRVPFVMPEEYQRKQVSNLSKINTLIVKYIKSYCLYEEFFKLSPVMQTNGNDLKERVKTFFNYENHLFTQILINEAIINEKIFEVYELTEADKNIVLTSQGKSIGELPVNSEAKEAYLADNEATKEFSLDEIRSFIENLPEKEFSSEEQNSIENEFPCLYQNNNDLEEFCIRHEINPINVWYWFKKINVIPKQRMNDIAMEFLADMIREILMEDEDGIIPLVANAGEKILLERVEDKFREKGFSQAQYSSFDNVLGRELNDYLNNYFFKEFSDHLNLFMYLPKTPFIWHLSSGKEQGFDCYIIIYKWSRDNLMRLKSVYIEHRERALRNRQSDLALNESAEAQNEKDKIFKQLNEIEEFKKKIDELLEEGYNPILDDGVGKNIAPLQNKNMIPYEVLNSGQLKKYLNADW